MKECFKTKTERRMWWLHITSASHAVPLPNGLGHLLSHTDAVTVEPLVAVITATGSQGGGRHVSRAAYTQMTQDRSANIMNHHHHPTPSTYIMKQLMSGLRQMQ